MPVSGLVRRGRGARRFFLAFGCVIANLMFSGCASVPPSVRKIVTDDGISGNQITRFAGMVFLYTISWVPGSGVPDAGSGSKRKVRCKSSTSVASVSWKSTEISASDAESACNWILAGVDYVGRFVSSTLPPVIHYRLYLVPSGRSVQRRSFSWEPLGKLHPLYVAHWYPDRARTKENIVDTYAHESVHLRAAVLGMPDSKYGNEHVARLAGACAQLYVDGALRKAYYVMASPPEQMNLRKGYERSFEAGWDFSSRIFPMFDSNGLIERDSASGRQLVAYCKKKLTAFFGGQR